MTQRFSVFQIKKKKKLINYFVENGIHMMIEKPLWFDNLQLFKKYEKLILKKNLFLIQHITIDLNHIYKDKENIRPKNSWKNL